MPGTTPTAANPPKDRPAPRTAEAGTVDGAEIDKFSAMAREWWDPAGKFRPLHRVNPTRLQYIRDICTHHFALGERDMRPFAGRRLLDIGCGGGLLCEPMRRLGADVVGADASGTNISVAALHAREQGLDIDYRATTAEALAQAGERFDIVLNMEVVEHVGDVELFMASCARLVAPGGVMVVATLSRTLKAFALAIVGAEYVLGWLPRGTHNWRKFITPEDLRAHIEKAGLAVTDEKGVTYNPLSDQWSLSRDMDVNYMMVATREA